MTYTGGSSSTREFVYLYDESGIIGVLYGTSMSTLQPYYFHRNLQGDVIAIYDKDGNRKVEYTYDAFGNCSVVYGFSHELAQKNPIRYRGYYYDRETKLYYLNARYYNPEWRRFISPDSTDYIDPDVPNGLNLYAYCNNDPVNYCDPSGCSITAAIVIGMFVGAIIGGTFGGVYAYNQAVLDGDFGLTLYLRTLDGISKGVAVGGVIGGLFVYHSPAIGAFLSTSFPIVLPEVVNGAIQLAIVGSVTGAQLVEGALVVSTGILLYESKKAAPRIKSSTRKKAYDKAFHKGGKKPPIYHPHGKFGPHFHPNNPKFKHWHYYFSLLWWLLTDESEDFPD